MVRGFPWCPCPPPGTGLEPAGRRHLRDAHPPSSLPLADFNYGADDYDAEGNEEPKALPEGSETMPYIDESPTMSPQLSARGQDSGDGVSPTPTDGLGTGVGGLGAAKFGAGGARLGGICGVGDSLVVLSPRWMSPLLPKAGSLSGCCLGWGCVHPWDVSVAPGAGAQPEGAGTPPVPCPSFFGRLGTRHSHAAGSI